MGQGHTQQLGLSVPTWTWALQTQDAGTTVCCRLAGEPLGTWPGRQGGCGKSADSFIALGKGTDCSGALGGAGPLPLHHHRLLAAQDGAGSVDGSHTQIRAVLVLSDHVPDAAEGGPGVLVDGGPHVRSGRLSLAWWGGEKRGTRGQMVWTFGAHPRGEGTIPPREPECPDCVSLGGSPISKHQLTGQWRGPPQARPCTCVGVSSPACPRDTARLVSLDRRGSRVPCTVA